MKSLVGVMAVVVSTMLTSIVYADTSPSPPTSDHPFRIGFGMDIGAPSGAALGVVVHPKIDYVVAEAALTYNYLSFGGRLNLQFDPITLVAPKSPIGLFADLQGGFFPQGNVPGHSDWPSVGYDYFNAYLGLRFGRANGFSWRFEAGPSYLYAATGNFQSVVNAPSGVSVGNPTLQGWIFPSASTGFQVVWP